MIAGDYLYTNYLCRIATILGGEVESDIDAGTKHISLSFAGTEIYFRYNNDGFILENQYGENSVHPAVESFLALLIRKALNKEGKKNKDIRINGRKINIDPRVIPLMGYIWYIYSSPAEDMSIRPSTPHCTSAHTCPFAGICKQKIESVISDNIDLMDILHQGLQHLYETNIIFDLIVYSDENDVYMKVLDNLFDFEVRVNSWEDKIVRVKRKIAEDIGYRKADVIVELVLKKMMDDIKPLRANINTEDYGGYLVRYGEYVLPSDKVWKELFGREIEKYIIKFYEKSGYFKSRRVRK